MTLFRNSFVRSGCTGLVTLGTITLNLTPAIAGARSRNAITLLQPLSAAIHQSARPLIALPSSSPAEATVQALAVQQGDAVKAKQKAAQKSVAPEPSEDKPDSAGSDSSAVNDAAAESTPVEPLESSLLIRVKIGEAVQGAVQFAASTDAVLNAGNQSFQLASGTLYTAAASSDGLQVGDLTVSSLEVDPGEGYVFIHDRWYSGKLHLALTSEGLITVNELPLETYLYSVVGAEMPTSWSLEALKAQAVAARSYAVAHLERPASDWYAMGDDERWQAYKGAQTMDANSIEAVQSTLGQVLTRDGHIHEAQYAATEAISREAHGGRGMSQHGAQEMAEAGSSYLEILGRYYSGTAIAALQ